MLPPHLRSSRSALTASSSLASRASIALLRAGVAHSQSRAMWNWRRSDWASQLDPLYLRFNRYHTLKCRAKLLETLRRRGKLDWDDRQRPLLSSKSQRSASHWSGKPGGPRWHSEVFDDKASSKKDGNTAEVDNAKADGHDAPELSKREKKWKELMEAMRHRIERRDPYEAVFGRRFEPFWSPLVPSWMREEMGLPKGAPKANQTEAIKSQVNTQPEARKDKKSDLTANPISNSSYSYASSTTYDPWTNKTKRTEWDSASGRTKRYEYDPISNRMVPIQELSALKVETKPESTSSDKRTAISVPTYSRNVTVEPAKNLMESSPSNIQPSKPSDTPSVASDELESGLDSLTASDVRASMGKTQSKSRTLEKNSDLGIPTGGIETALRRWDKVKRQSLLQNDNVKLKDEKCRGEAEQERLEKDLKKYEWSNRRFPGYKEALTASSLRDHSLQSALDRMQSKESVSHFVVEDPDDSAAHESTEPIELPASVPKDWSIQNDLLQSARVKRSGSDLPMEPTSSNDSPRQAASEGSLARKINTLKMEKAEQAFLSSEQNQTTATLEAKVKEQQSRLEAQKIRYGDKIRNLRHDLDVAYKESSQTSEDHLERIRFLEAELDKAQDSSAKAKSTSASTSAASEPMIRGEGDFCVNVTKFMDNGMWYKQPAKFSMVSDYALQKAEQKVRDESLVKEVREIYEQRYGKINARHRQVNPGLDKALDKHEQGNKTYKFEKEGVVKYLNKDKPDETLLEKALTKHEKELQNRPPRVEVPVEEPTAKLNTALAKHEKNPELYRFKEDGLALEIAQQAKNTSMAIAAAAQGKVNESDKQPTESASSGEAVEWETPPVYKVLAYDSGNDMFSTATTTSNFTPSENPISIPQALSQLYQPARFVPYFAELQKDGYQVIYGTRDLLVFKKVKSVSIPDAIEQKNTPSLAQEKDLPPKPKEVTYSPLLVDHGLLKPKENELAQEAANYYDATRMAVNPVDGTSRPATGNFASPTGFVNHDPIFPVGKETAQQVDESSMHDVDSGWIDPNRELDSSAQSAHYPDLEQYHVPEDPEDVPYDYVHYPRVRRQESVYSGGKLVRRLSKKQRKQERREERHSKRRRGAGAIRWALSVGLGAAALTYTIGVAAEIARQESRKKEKSE